MASIFGQIEPQTFKPKPDLERRLREVAQSHQPTSGLTPFVNQPPHAKTKEMIMRDVVGKRTLCEGGEVLVPLRDGKAVPVTPSGTTITAPGGTTVTVTNTHDEVVYHVMSQKEAFKQLRSLLSADIAKMGKHLPGVKTEPLALTAGVDFAAGETISGNIGQMHPIGTPFSAAEDFTTGEIVTGEFSVTFEDSALHRRMIQHTVTPPVNQKPLAVAITASMLREEAKLACAATSKARVEQALDFFGVNKINDIPVKHWRQAYEMFKNMHAPRDALYDKL